MKSKALLLLFIFLLNTVTGFACALRMSIHEYEEVTEHHHEGSEVTEHGHHSNEATEHHHDDQQVSPLSVDEEPFPSGTYIAKNDPCCQTAVNNFNTLAKVTPQSSQIILLAPLTYIGAYHQFFLTPVTVSQVNRFLSIDGRRRPPTYPIRIALQSFQI
ncbi:hypothetical protein [Mucilaginibacter sp.]|uniref:hypothetical protein n=1 Tax=Mucilaginibacter sp. TaxID=1882438 RepID=UPI00374DC4B1